MTSKRARPLTAHSSADCISDEESGERHEGDLDEDEPDMTAAVEADAVTRATEDLTRAEAILTTAEAHETAAQQAHRDAQEHLIKAAIRRRAVRDCVMELGGFRADDALVAEVEAGARAAAGLVALARAQLAEARIRVTNAQHGRQVARQSLVEAKQMAYGQEHCPELHEALIAGRDHLATLSNASDRSRVQTSIIQLTRQICAQAEAAGIV